MNTALSAFLRRRLGMPFAWGRSDCGLWLADWAVDCGHPDPAAAWRGRYGNAAGAAQLTGPLGLARAVQRFAAALGLPRTDDPLPGDIAVLRAPGMHVGAIRTPLGWAVLAEGAGVSSVPAAAARVAAGPWRMTEGRGHA